MKHLPSSSSLAPPTATTKQHQYTQQQQHQHQPQRQQQKEQPSPHPPHCSNAEARIREQKQARLKQEQKEAREKQGDERDEAEDVLALKSLIPVLLTALSERLAELQAHDLVTSPAPPLPPLWRLLQLRIDWCVELFGGMRFRREQGIVRALALLRILHTRIHSLLVSITCNEGGGRAGGQEACNEAGRRASLSALVESWNESGQQERRATRTASVSEKESFDESDKQMRRRAHLRHKVFEAIGVMNKVVLTAARAAQWVAMCDALRDVVAKKIERQEELRRVGPQNMAALAIQREMRRHLQARAKAALMIQRIARGVAARRRAKKQRQELLLDALIDRYAELYQVSREDLICSLRFWRGEEGPQGNGREHSVQDDASDDVADHNEATEAFNRTSVKLWRPHVSYGGEFGRDTHQDAEGGGEEEGEDGSEEDKQVYMERLVRSTSPTAHFASASLVRYRSLGLLPPKMHRQQDRELLPSRAFSALGFEASHSTRRFESKTSEGQYAASHNSYEASPTSVGLARVRGGDDKPKLIWVLTINSWGIV